MIQVTQALPPNLQNLLMQLSHTLVCPQIKPSILEGNLSISYFATHCQAVGYCT